MGHPVAAALVPHRFGSAAAKRLRGDNQARHSQRPAPPQRLEFKLVVVRRAGWQVENVLRQIADGAACGWFAVALSAGKR